LKRLNFDIFVNEVESMDPVLSLRRVLPGLLLTLFALPSLAEPLWPCGSRTGSDLLPLDLTPRIENGAPITIDMSQMVKAPTTRCRWAAAMAIRRIRPIW
jgi:hypothetical protein